jgi:hypothetical protein
LLAIENVSAVVQQEGDSTSVAQKEGEFSASVVQKKGEFSASAVQKEGELVSAETISSPVVQQDMDISLNGSILCNVPPPLVSTHVSGNACVPSGIEVSPLSPLVDSANAGSLESEPKEVEGGGYVDMHVDLPKDEPLNSELKSSVCKGLAKLFGKSTELSEFDKVRLSAKSRVVPLRSDLHKHKKFAKHFRKLVCRHKAHLEQLLVNEVPDTHSFTKRSRDLKLCLQLICNLH